MTWLNWVGLILVAVVAFAIGYRIIEWLMDRLQGGQKRQPGSDAAGRGGEPSVGGHDNRERQCRAEPETAHYEDPETRFARVLDLRMPCTTSEIRERYRQLINQYHPDKAAHLGPELRELAERRTREILEAYEYFRVKYRL